MVILSVLLILSLLLLMPLFVYPLLFSPRKGCVPTQSLAAEVVALEEKVLHVVLLILLPVLVLVYLLLWQRMSLMQSLAAEVVALEEKVLQVRSREIWLEKETGRLKEGVQQAEQQLQSSQQDRASLQATIDMLQVCQPCPCKMFTLLSIQKRHSAGHYRHAAGL